MTTTRAVVLARGLGTRMRRPDQAHLTPDQTAMADRGVKAMIAVGRPFLDYILSGLADAGIRDVCVVIGPEHGVVRQRYQQDIVPARLSVEFAEQEVPRGTADAVLAAAPVVGLAPFLVVNSDNLYPTAALALLGSLKGAGLIGYQRDPLIAESNIPPGRIAQFALAWSDDQGNLTRLVEKPSPADAADPAAAVSMNSWRFESSIFEACRAVHPSPRHELELQDAVHILLARGEALRVVPFSGGVLDLSSRSDIGPVAAAVQSIDVRL